MPESKSEPKKAKKKVTTKAPAKKAAAASAVKKAPAAAKARTPKSPTGGVTLIIAEKPSVAGDLAKALGGKFVKEKTHYQGDEYIISYAIGHLVTIADPKEMGEQYKNWGMESLPIIPEQFVLKPIPESKAQLAALGKLIRLKEVDHIINACDAGREGELIFRYILLYENNRKPLGEKRLSRMWMQSMTTDAIRQAFAKLRDDGEMKRLEDAALSRSEADWLVGINGSRGLTAYNSRRGGFQLTPCGRVQTPTLSMIVRREEERSRFVPRDYWTVKAQFRNGSESYEGKWFDSAFQKVEGSPELAQDRIWQAQQAQDIIDRCQGRIGSVEETTKPVSQRCPPLYDLTSLQREANSRFGLSAKATLQIAQSLYERYKATTYPRTDSKFLPEDYIDTAKTVLGSLQEGPLASHAAKVLKQGWVRKDPRIFDNTKISDHHAIIPTGTMPQGLSDAEAKIYNLICQRFIAIFYPAAQYQQTQRITTVEDQTFRTDGKVLLDAGWRAVYGKESEEESLVPPISPDAKPVAQSIQSEQDITRPPARYNEASLLSAMEGAGKLVDDEDMRDAMKERGLGTPATRAAVIEKLISDKYIVRDGKELAPTTKAFDLIRLTSAMKIEDFTSPELTGEWEYKLGLLEQGKYTRLQFMSEIEGLTRKIVDRIRNFDEESTRQEAPFSPVNGKRIFETVSRYEAEDGSLQIRKILGGRNMSHDEVITLITHGKVGPISDFRSRKGSPFTALIVLNDKGQAEFVFQDDDSSPEGGAFDINTQEPIGVSPVDGSPVYETLTSYISLSAMEKAPTGLRLNKVILGKEISIANMQRMLAGERSELITGMRSAKTRRNFDAFLRLEASGKLKFEFPDTGPRRRFPARKAKDAE